MLTRPILRIKDIIFLTIISILVVSFSMVKIIDKYVMPVLLNYAESETMSIMTYVINDAVNKNTNSSLEINNIIKTVTNSDNEIISLDFDTILINKSLHNITSDIGRSLKDLERNTFVNNKDYEIINSKNGIIYNIPVGVVFGNSILSNLGPKIPINASLIGDVTTEVKTEVSAYGINNSLIKVFVNTNINAMIVLPFSSKKMNINNDILIGMKVVQGSIPKFYGSAFSNSTPIVSGNTN